PTCRPAPSCAGGGARPRRRTAPAMLPARPRPEACRKDRAAPEGAACPPRARTGQRAVPPALRAAASMTGDHLRLRHEDRMARLDFGGLRADAPRHVNSILTEGLVLRGEDG